MLEPPRVQQAPLEEVRVDDDPRLVRLIVFDDEHVRGFVDDLVLHHAEARGVGVGMLARRAVGDKDLRRLFGAEVGPKALAPSSHVWLRNDQTLREQVQSERFDIEFQGASFREGFANVGSMLFYNI